MTKAIPKIAAAARVSATDWMCILPVLLLNIDHWGPDCQQGRDQQQQSTDELKLAQALT